MSRQRVTVWITKYALTHGITKAEAEECSSPGMIAVSRPGCLIQFFHGNEWHRSESEAVARAEKLRTDKIASLEKQIKRIKALTFASEATP